MTTSEHIVGRLALFLATPAGESLIAARTLSRHLGIPVDAAKARLASAPGFVADDLESGAAARLKDTLRVLGLPVSLHAAAAPDAMDISIQLTVWADTPRVIARLSTLLTLEPDEVAFALSQPGGLTLTAVKTPVAAEVMSKTRCMPGVVATLSDPLTATYDIHLSRDLNEGERVTLGSLCRILGAKSDPLTEAVATGLDRRTRDLLLSRAVGMGLLALDRRFQRFDLILSGAAGWTTAELADFLVARTNKPRAAFEQIDPATPLLLDLGLKEQVARQFCGDYAAIGLMVRPVLSNRVRNP